MEELEVKAELLVKRLNIFEEEKELLKNELIIVLKDTYEEGKDAALDEILNQRHP